MALHIKEEPQSHVRHALDECYQVVLSQTHT